jgi:hypothetical protein
MQKIKILFIWQINYNTFLKKKQTKEHYNAFYITNLITIQLLKKAKEQLNDFHITNQVILFISQINS